LIENNKSRQEKAALTFTTVNVVFLPLTMIASVLGMNTYDIRNMNQRQGLSWVVALPTCFTAVLLWLAYLGSLGFWINKIRRTAKKAKAAWERCENREGYGNLNIRDLQIPSSVKQCPRILESGSAFSALPVPTYGTYREFA
jgi:hypothetical protein